MFIGVLSLKHKAKHGYMTQKRFFQLLQKTNKQPFPGYISFFNPIPSLLRFKFCKESPMEHDQSHITKWIYSQNELWVWFTRLAEYSSIMYLPMLFMNTYGIAMWQCVAYLLQLACCYIFKLNIDVIVLTKSTHRQKGKSAPEKDLKTAPVITLIQSVSLGAHFDMIITHWQKQKVKSIRVTCRCGWKFKVVLQWLQLVLH